MQFFSVSSPFQYRSPHGISTLRCKLTFNCDLHHTTGYASAAEAAAFDKPGGRDQLRLSRPMIFCASVGHLQPVPKAFYRVQVGDSTHYLSPGCKPWGMGSGQQGAYQQIHARLYLERQRGNMHTHFVRLRVLIKIGIAHLLSLNTTEEITQGLRQNSNNPSGIKKKNV